MSPKAHRRNHGIHYFSCVNIYILGRTLLYLCSACVCCFGSTTDAEGSLTGHERAWIETSQMVFVVVVCFIHPGGTKLRQPCKNPKPPNKVSGFLKVLISGNEIPT